MARPKQGWKLVAPAEPGGFFTVRFTHAGRRYHRSTGERDKAAAARRAAEVYNDALEGRLDPPPPAAGDVALLDLVALWLAALESSYTPATRGLYETYARVHWLPRWPLVADLTEGAIGLYQRERLGLVARVTVRKELVALRRFGEWAKEQGHLAAPLIFPRLPPKATGRRRTDRKERATELDASEVGRLLAALPEWSSRPGRDGRPIRLRAFFEFLWETALRPATVEALVAGEHWTPGADQLRITADIDKTRYARPVPLTPRARELLRQVGATAGERIFGAYDRRDPLDAAGRVALPPDKARTLSVYDLRHARITHWVGEGHGLDAVAYLAGHRQITTTAIYTHGTAKAAARVVAPSRRGGWRRAPAQLRRGQGAAWDYGQDRGQEPKSSDARLRGRARVLLGILAVCAKEGT